MEPRIFKDQLQRTVKLSGFPKRIVSLVPSQTELICDLGLEEYLVGATKFCVHPKGLRSNTTIVGGTKQIKRDIIADLKPDIILCNKEENTKEIIEALETLAPVHVSDIYTLQDSFELITDYGIMLGCETKAEHIRLGIEQELSKFKEFVLNKPVFKVAYFIWRNPWMGVGKQTFIDHLLTVNGFENCLADKMRYPEIDFEVLKEKNPDFIFLSSEPYPFKNPHKAEVRKHLPNAEVVFVDGEFFSWYGSRLLGAFKYFTSLRKQL